MKKKNVKAKMKLEERILKGEIERCLQDQIIHNLRTGFEQARL